MDDVDGGNIIFYSEGKWMKGFKNFQTLFRSDILRGMRVSLRYLFGAGASEKASFDVSGTNSVGKIPAYDAQRCSGCRLCVNVCPSKAIRVRTNLNSPSSGVDFHLDSDRCVSCGLCIEACPVGALDFEGIMKNVRR